MMREVTVDERLPQVFKPLPLGHSPELVDPHDRLPLVLAFELGAPPLQLGPLRARIVAPRVRYERVDAVEGCGERLDKERRIGIVPHHVGFGH